MRRTPRSTLLPYTTLFRSVASPGHRAKRGLSDLADGELVVLHIDDRLERVDDPVIDDRIYPQRDVVAGDGLLSGHSRHGDLHIDLAEPVCEGVDPGQPRLTRAGKRPAKAEDNAFLELFDDLETKHFLAVPSPADGAPG